MRRHHQLSAALAGILATGSLGDIAISATPASATAKAVACGSITKAQILADGFTHAAGPRIAVYIYKKSSANPTNALGTTIDFGAKSVVVSCVSPADLRSLSATVQGPSKPALSASQYINYLSGVPPVRWRRRWWADQ